MFNIKNIIRNLFNGILIGIVNPIPGVSGGTIMVLLGIFDNITISITHIFSKNKNTNLKDILYIFQIFLGISIGAIFFSKLLRLLYINFLPQTMCCFSGLIIFSIPLLIKNEIKTNKINIKYFLFGLIIIFLIFISSKNSSTNIETLPISISLILNMLLIGIISGSITIFPGISGSMVLLLLGKYYTYNHYLSEITSLNSNILIPVFFILIGIILGTIIASKLSVFLLSKYHKNTMSIIIGFLLMSGIIIIPFDYNYNLLTITTSILCFILGGVIVTELNKIKKVINNITFL